MSGEKRFDVRTTGPDAVRVTIGGYGTPEIAYIQKADGCTPEQWAQFKRWLIEAEVEES